MHLLRSFRPLLAPALLLGTLLLPGCATESTADAMKLADQAEQYAASAHRIALTCGAARAQAAVAYADAQHARAAANDAQVQLQIISDQTRISDANTTLANRLQAYADDVLGNYQKLDADYKRYFQLADELKFMNADNQAHPLARQDTKPLEDQLNGLSIEMGNTALAAAPAALDAMHWAQSLDFKTAWPNNLESTMNQYVAMLHADINRDPTYAVDRLNEARTIAQMLGNLGRPFTLLANHYRDLATAANQKNFDAQQKLKQDVNAASTAEKAAHDAANAAAQACNQTIPHFSSQPNPSKTGWDTSSP